MAEGLQLKILKVEGVKPILASGGSDPSQDVQLVYQLFQDYQH